MIVLGPGSLFSSVLPNLLISDVRDALAAAPGLKAYVCNVATQPGETETMTRFGSPRSALQPCRRGPDRLRHPQPQHRCAPPRGLARAAGRGRRPTARGAAGRDHRGGRHRPRQRASPRSRQARSGAHAPPAGGPDLATALAAHRPPGGRRLLTVAVLLAGEVKGELARIQPARACDRRAELIGLLHGSSRGSLRTLDHATARTAVHLASSLGLPVASPRAVEPDRARVGARHHLVVELDREALGAVVVGRGAGLRPSRLPAWRAARLGLDLVRRPRPARRVRPARPHARPRSSRPRSPRWRCGPSERSGALATSST